MVKESAEFIRSAVEKQKVPVRALSSNIRPSRLSPAVRAAEDSVETNGRTGTLLEVSRAASVPS